MSGAHTLWSVELIHSFFSNSSQTTGLLRGEQAQRQTLPNRLGQPAEPQAWELTASHKEEAVAEAADEGWVQLVQPLQ